MVLEEAGMDDYSFVYMEGSHKYHDQFFRDHPDPLELEDGKKAVGMMNPDAYVQMTYDDLKYFEEKGCGWRKVVAGKGTLVLWDSRTIHSTAKPTRGRRTVRPRFLLYGGLVPYATMTESKVKKAWQRWKECSRKHRERLVELCHKCMNDGVARLLPPLQEEGDDVSLLGRIGGKGFKAAKTLLHLKSNEMVIGGRGARGGPLQGNNGKRCQALLQL